MQSIYRERNSYVTEDDGKKFTICAIETMEYNGEWVSYGFKVTHNGISKRYTGYPVRNDLKKFDTMPDFNL
jgi:hypothetical protein